ncbi:hypothetical protein OPKNFCMD_2895 [Methylobacterium crusticola]|uniref:DUF3072 domain-containing protein n=1 Tax=Methylobacterium crusticola TaxID=1697972 RepID=A0ABQ4QXY9_9HYPH|nr:hypothetical protein [Methylobacterium crusticola]GJD50158.1 hypothetical protein OPKNFCMD_2895 [Methylobacterium crusticola]
MTDPNRDRTGAQAGDAAKPDSPRPNLRSFDAYADRNGQDMGQDDPLDLARPADLQRRLNEDPDWDAEVARIASDRQRLDATQGGSIATVEATEAETPAENLRRISDPSTSKPADR